MQKQKENLFRDKFSLLNSQESSEVIKWSSSSTSEYESTSINEKFSNLDKTRNRKRKRKKKVQKNVSNLDITIIDSCKEDHKSGIVAEKSPILMSKRISNIESPILMTSRVPPIKNTDTNSPILCNKSLKAPQSPILPIKTTSPCTMKVRKKLCYENGKNTPGPSNISNKNQKSVIKTSNGIKGHHIISNVTTTIESQMKQNKIDIEGIYIKSEPNSITDSDSSIKVKLLEKVKNFFDSRFSSDNTSQNISDTPTPTTTDVSRNEDIEILTCKSQSICLNQSIKLENASSSDISPHFETSAKKHKYKKGGLAYRLNTLLKKQNAHISLWQHERFLARNSSFVIPKEDNVVFRIKTIDFNYGYFLLHAVDFDSKLYLIIINCKYVNSNISVDSVFKLYEPYRILEGMSDPKIVVGVCKFECFVINEQS